MKKLILISIILMSFMSFSQEDFGNGESETDTCLEVSGTTIDDNGSIEGGSIEGGSTISVEN